jgi:outer membrane protein
VNNSKKKMANSKIRRSLAALISFLLLALPQASHAQSILSGYVQAGLSSNIDVRRMGADYQRSLWALQEARRLYGPSIDATGSYTRSFPHPVALPKSLLDLANSDDGRHFDPIANVYRAGVQVTQTLYNGQLRYNKEAMNEASASSQDKLSDFKIALTADIRSAYFQYVEAWFVRKAQVDGLLLTEQTLSAVQRQIEAQKTTKDVLYKAKSNVSISEQNINNAENVLEKARYYFNFLLNRPLDAEISIDSGYLFSSVASYHIKKAEADSSSQYRYNLSFLLHSRQQAIAQMNSIRAERLPVATFTGFGGTAVSPFSIDKEAHPTAQLAIVLKWNLFNNGTLKARYSQANYQQQIVQDQYAQQANQMALQKSNALQDVQAQLTNQNATKAAFEYAEVYHKALVRKFELGTATILELTDADNVLLQASIQQQIWYYDLLIKAVSYDKATGSTLQIIP